MELEFILIYFNIYFKGQLSIFLQQVELNVYDPVNCADVLASQTKDWDKEICAGDLLGGKDTCVGKSYLVEVNQKLFNLNTFN